MDQLSEKITTEALQLLSPEQANHYQVIPVEQKGNSLFAYISEQQSIDEAEEELEMLLGQTVRLEHASSEWVNQSLQKHYGQTARTSNSYEAPIDPQDEAFVVRLIEQAQTANSSDIHIEVYEHRCRVRLRIDGKLKERFVIEKDDYPSLVNKIKIMAHLDIAEKRLPQDGRIMYEANGVNFDIRVSVLPTLHGEKIVLRILGGDASQIDLSKLGMRKQDHQNYLESIKHPHGIILVSGPTGSGKTTTLYATLKLLNEESRNIMTIEDPVEYTLEGINQVQLKEKIGLNFSSTLRSFLRQDPDVIMVGEIRDTETAQMAIRAALTGHLVLSTIHTNSAWGTVSRLMDMGVEPYLLAGTLNASLAQRLVRLLCPDCKKEETLDPKLFPKRFSPPTSLEKHWVPVGCPHCMQTGYKGRKAIYEILPIDEILAKCIHDQKQDISDYLKESGLQSLSDNAFSLLKKGETSMEEVYTLL